MNPLKKWGSWLGAILGAITGIYIFRTIVIYSEFYPTHPRAWITPFIPIIVGFGLGYATHIVIERLVKREE